MLSSLIVQAQDAATISATASTTVNSIFSAFGTFVSSNAVLIITVAIFGGLISVAWNKIGFGRR